MKPPHRTIAILTMVAILAFVTGRLTAGDPSESCFDWNERYSQALMQAINGSASDRKAVTIVQASRPAGCR